MRLGRWTEEYVSPIKQNNWASTQSFMDESRIPGSILFYWIKIDRSRLFIGNLDCDSESVNGQPTAIPYFIPKDVWPVIIILLTAWRLVWAESDLASEAPVKCNNKIYNSSFITRHWHVSENVLESGFLGHHPPRKCIEEGSRRVCGVIARVECGQYVVGSAGDESLSVGDWIVHFISN